MSISTWLRDNKLVLNVSKSNYGNNTHKSLHILHQCHVIKGVSEYKFIRVIMDDIMTWKNHINYVCYTIEKE